MSELIDFALVSARNVLLVWAILIILSLVVLLGAGVFITARNTIRHIWRGNVRNAARFATYAATTAAEGEVRGRGGVVLEWLLSFVTYRENRLLSIPTDYSEKSDEFVYTTIRAGER